MADLKQALIWLAEGRKIRKSNWINNYYVELTEEGIYNSQGLPCSVNGSSGLWQLYEEPKLNIYDGINDHTKFTMIKPIPPCGNEGCNCEYDTKPIPSINDINHNTELWNLGNEVVKLRQRLDPLNEDDIPGILVRLLELVNDIRIATYTNYALKSNPILPPEYDPREVQLKNALVEDGEYIVWAANGYRSFAFWCSDDKAFYSLVDFNSFALDVKEWKKLPERDGR